MTSAGLAVLGQVLASSAGGVNTLGTNYYPAPQGALAKDCIHAGLDQSTDGAAKAMLYARLDSSGGTKAGLLSSSAPLTAYASPSSPPSAHSHHHLQVMGTSTCANYQNDVTHTILSGPKSPTSLAHKTSKTKTAFPTMLPSFARHLRLHSAAASRALSSASAASSPVKVLVIDGYSPDGRADLEAGGASTAGKLYINLLNKSAPAGVEIASDVVYPADSDFQTPELSKYHAVAWTGCSLTIHDAQDVRVTKQIDFAKKVFEEGIPQYGSCWAAQIAVAAAGGHCGANPRGREMGVARKIELSPEGRAHPMFEGKPSVFDAFTSHNDEVTHMPPGGLALGGNDFTAVQAVAVRHKKGDFWAVQYHPEYDLHELARLTYCRRAKLVSLGFFADMKSADQYVDDLENLHIDPSRYDIAWRLGLDADVMDENIRHCETRNFIKYLALPYKAAVESK